MNETVKKIAEIIENITNIPSSDIRAESMLLDDLELSSLDIMMIIDNLEKTFCICFSERELMRIITVGDVAQCIQSRFG